MNELKSYTEYAVSTPTVDFVIGFDFNYGEDAVNVTVDDVPATEAGYTVVYLNETTIRLSPSVPSGVVRLQRETDIDQSDHAYRAGAKFIAQTMDENFEQLRHSQQEVRDGFGKLKDDTYALIDGLDEAIGLAQDAAHDAQDAAVIAQDAADTVNAIIIGGKVSADKVLDESGKTQQEINNQRIKTLWDFGATGVGDDAHALQQALDHGLFAITGTHKILSPVYVKNNVWMLGQGGTLEPSMTRGVINFQTPRADIFFMRDVQVDGSNYNGTRNDEHGMYFINAGESARPTTLILKGNILKNIYGDGFRAYCDNCDVTGNTLINVAGLNLVNHPSGAYDNYGDGIHIMGAKSGVVAGNYIVNDETTNVDLGRGGVVLEFGAENVSVFGNTIRGYDRGIHAETVLAPLIENNNVDLCGTAVLLSDAPQTIIRNNILLSTTAKTTGLFGTYGTIYDYNGNSSVIEGNVISAGIGRKAILGNGATKRKFTKINKNRINGDVLITAGAVGAEFSSNIIGETLTSVINITGRSVTDKNTVHNDSYITLAAPSGSVSSNAFESPSVVPLRITNPTNLSINDNTFNLTAGYSFAYTVDCTAASTALIGECSGNIINSDLSVAMFRYSTASAVHHPFICNRPNLLKTSVNKISALKFLAPNNFGQRSLTYFSNVSTEPNDGRYYDQGGRVELSAPPATGATGYLVVTSGYASSVAWAATTAYTVNNIVYSGTRVYKCTVAGTSGSTAPTHTSGTAVDGSATWEYVGTKAVFRQLT